MKRVIFYSLFVAVVVWFFFRPQPTVRLGNGVKAPEAPFQVPLTPAMEAGKSFFAEGYVITPKAKFELTGKILSRRTYSFGRQTDLSPIDLALGWGRMSDEAVIEHLKIKQRVRFYFWKTRGSEFPIPAREITSHSANMHLIPADSAVKKAILNTKRGQIVSLRGRLVDVLAPKDLWQWKSSMVRDDSGGGACEVIWVESFEVVESEG